MAKNTISKINVNDEDYYLVDEEARNALQVMKGATSEEPGEAGIVPAPEVAPAQGNRILADDGTWKTVSEVGNLGVAGLAYTEPGDMFTMQRALSGFYTLGLKTAGVAGGGQLL